METFATGLPGNCILLRGLLQMLFLNQEKNGIFAQELFCVSGAHLTPGAKGSSWRWAAKTKAFKLHVQSITSTRLFSSFIYFYLLEFLKILNIRRKRLIDFNHITALTSQGSLSRSPCAVAVALPCRPTALRCYQPRSC